MRGKVLDPLARWEREYDEAVRLGIPFAVAELLRGATGEWPGEVLDRLSGLVRSDEPAVRFAGAFAGSVRWALAEGPVPGARAIEHIEALCEVGESARGAFVALSGLLEVDLRPVAGDGYDPVERVAMDERLRRAVRVVLDGLG
ncbi:hypothetical protein [Actinosynnema pretiosum]|uniref:Uncharacterized protein n=1 Tax=Actinosynnema pretiosum TaxID=42197 RepID=A0A290Z3S7_9PSEU|nr:hypothetical protein [Actinosynnema pretiosum]ATE53657.1 hypothetical protein CNX65_10445 [Actinosynnema pretiosum]